MADKSMMLPTNEVLNKETETNKSLEGNNGVDQITLQNKDNILDKASPLQEQVRFIVDENMNLPPNNDLDEESSDSVKIITYNPHFFPYQTHLEREFSEEDCIFMKQLKRKRAINNWHWNEVVDLCTSEKDTASQQPVEDESTEDELEDTTDSQTSLSKQFKIRKRVVYF